MCQTSCPVKIDTGALVKEMRAASQGRAARWLASFLAGHYGAVAAAARAGLRAAALLRAVPGGRTSALRHHRGPAPRGAVGCSRTSGRRWTCRGRRRRCRPRARRAEAGAVVYFPSCLTRIVGPLPGEDALPLAGAMLDVLDAGGLRRRLSPGVGRAVLRHAVREQGLPPRRAAPPPRARRRRCGPPRTQGRDTVVTDASPCAGTLQDLAVRPLARDGRPMRVLDFPSFWAAEVLARAARPAAARGRWPCCIPPARSCACAACPTCCAWPGPTAPRWWCPRAPSAAASRETAASWSRS